MSNALFIRTDAGPQLGIGHFMRMLALAEAWAATGGLVTFGGALPEQLARRAQALGANVLSREGTFDDASWTVARAREANADLLVADGYTFPLPFQRAVRANGLRLMVVDDNAENQSYDADWILNVNVHATEALYAQRNPDCRCLLGTRYALIREAFRKAGRTANEVGSRRLLVTMGGSDPPNATGRILSALREDGRGLRTTVLVGAANTRLAEYRAQAGDDIELLFDVTDVAAAMGEADVALAAAGGTVWELGLVGVPCVALALAENQLQLAGELHRLGAVEYVGDARTAPDAGAWLGRVCEVLEDTGRSARLVARARTLVDGNGAQRVVQSIREN